MKLTAITRTLPRTAAFVALCFIFVVQSTAQTAPKLLPFQGRLTDQNGVAVSNGVRLVQFKIYDIPTGGSPAWAGELHRTTVNGGLVNVLLGSKTPFTGVDFDRQLYLEITADINGDNAVTLADPPMLPRQAILPVVFAKEAAESRLLDGYDWSSIMAGGSSNPSTSVIAEAKLPAGIVVPVGAVIMWWGNVSGIPPNFELCDGAAPTTPGSTLGGSKPDLRDKFVKGATNGATTIGNLTSGGTHTIAQRDSGGTILTTNQIPAHLHGSGSLVTTTDGAHTHSIRGPYSSDEGGNGTASAMTDDQNFGTITFPITATLDGAHSHTVTGNTGSTGNDQAHSHSIPAHDNRPAFQELFYIIRVK